ncbi:MAG TPA: hypothetical protein VEA60_12550, partial [Allosphingosinicella sp.]|nr:hypothetical protein [Allosphingosinicella sp.]
NLQSGNVVRYFGEPDLHHYTDPNAKFGKSGKELWVRRETPGINVRNASDAVRYSGNAASVTNAYTSDPPGRIFGYRTPANGLTLRVPTLADSGGYPHFLEVGETAVRTSTGSEGGYLRNRGATEFLVRGGEPVMRPGSTLFELVDGREVPIMQSPHNRWSNLTPRQARVLTGIRWGGRGLGVVGTVYGVYQDGSSIYSKYQADSLTGDYTDTKWEVARAGAGWAGAAAGGWGGAKVGAGIGFLIGGPIGAGIGGVVGGIVGGGLGYWYGSSTVENLRAAPVYIGPSRAPQMPTVSCTAGNQPTLPPGQRYFR